jgi:hypothetical protein
MQTNTALTALLGATKSGIPAVFPYHHKDVDEEIPLPHVTVCRFGDTDQMDRFHQTEFAGAMDNPRIAICVWSFESVDECWRIYRLIDPMLRPYPTTTLPNVSNQYFGAYKIKRTTCRDDLWDAALKAYHLHSEYSIRMMLTGVAQA